MKGRLHRKFYIPENSIDNEENNSTNDENNIVNEANNSMKEENFIVIEEYNFVSEAQSFVRDPIGRDGRVKNIVNEEKHSDNGVPRVNLD